MRRFRNPRFAPESLERKLSPSATITVAAQVYIPVSALDVPDDQNDGTDPPPPDGNGGVPQGPPGDPSGPPIPGPC